MLLIATTVLFLDLGLAFQEIVRYIHVPVVINLSIHVLYIYHDNNFMFYTFEIIKNSILVHVLHNYPVAVKFF